MLDGFEELKKCSEYPPDKSDLCCQKTNGHCVNVLVRDVLSHMTWVGVL